MVEGMHVPVFRCDEVTEILNGFRVWEYEYGTDLVNGRVYSYAEQTGLLDACLTEALAWAASEPDVTAARTSDGGNGAEVELADGTVIVWSAGEKQWVVTVADDGQPTAEPGMAVA